MMEVCVDNIQSVINAYVGGAKRIELCSALSEGGLTPTVGLLQAARRVTSPQFKIFVMIRPRGGDFVYSDNELNIMLEDLNILKKFGADGFVFGCLTTDKEVDRSSCQRLLTASGALPCTFHRAFDEVTKPLNVLKEVIELGFGRLLTSGGEDSAEMGKHNIKQLISLNKTSALIVMPGAGINVGNVQSILETTGAVEFHGSAREGRITNVDAVRKMVEIAKNMGIC